MPSDRRSERLLEIAEWVQRKHKADLIEAARLLAPYEQPEVAELLARADQIEAIYRKHLFGGIYREIGDALVQAASDLRAHAAAVVERAEARAKVAAVIDALENWTGQGGMALAHRITAALADADGEREVTE